MELIRSRRAIRKYKENLIESDKANLIDAELQNINLESGFKFQMILNNDEVLGNKIITFGMFKNARNIIALVGPSSSNDIDKEVDEKIGYYGARILLFIESINLSTCFITGTFSRAKTRASINKGETLFGIISFGECDETKKPRKTKNIEDVSDYKEGDPDWYLRGIEAALLAPTAVNQQAFEIINDGHKFVYIRNLVGFNTALDAGIIHYFFEKAADSDAYIWKRIHNRNR